jgi:16S rRNA (guanine(527)-N(7))-methyltransferase RsmG
MDTARIAALLEPFIESSLAEFQLNQISMYIDLLIRWNARINLTAIRKEEEIVTRHFGESFFMATHLFSPARAARTFLSAHASAHPSDDSQLSNPCHPERSRVESEAIDSAKSRDPDSSFHPAPLQGVPTVRPQVLDIGSGAGFPALPLKIWAPQIHLTLIESNHKKATFLREVTRALTVTNIDVIPDRVEAVADRLRAQAEVVTMRAVENFEAILPQAVTFLAPNGTLALLIGTAQIPKLAALTSLKWKSAIPVPQSHARVLSIGVLDKSGNKSALNRS